MKRAAKSAKQDIEEQPKSSLKITTKITVEELEVRLNVKLEEWQRKVVLEEKMNIIMRCSRKAGKTTAMAFKIVHDALNYPNWFVCILSAGQRQSGEVFQTVLDMLYLLGVEFRERPSATGCTLSNGHRILSLPTGYTGATIRTYSFYKIYYDEAAFIADEVRKATMACLVKHGIQVIIASTPKGSHGFFYKEWQEGKHFLRFYIPWYDIKHIPLERLRETIEEERILYGDKYVQQEYEALFVEQGAGLIPENLINQTFTDILNVEEGDTGKVFLGITTAPLGKNYSYIVLAHYSKNNIKILRLDILEHNNRTAGLLQKLQEIRKSFNVTKVITSETSVGVGSLDSISLLFGKKRVMSIESLSYNSEKISLGRRARLKEKDLYDHLIRLMELGRIQIIKDAMLEDALRSLDYDFKPGKENEIIISGRSKVIAEALVYSIVPTLLKHQNTLWVAGANPEAGEDMSWKALFPHGSILYSD